MTTRTAHAGAAVRRLLLAAVILAVSAVPILAQDAPVALSPVTGSEPATAPAGEAPATDPATLTLPAGSPVTAGTGADAMSAEPAPATASTLPHDLSPWGMFMAADWVVKAVMIGLVLASVATWTVWLAKSLELAAAKRAALRDLGALEGVRSLAEAAERMAFQRTPAAALVRAAAAELHQSADALDKDGVKERVASRLERIEAATGRRMTAGTGILATIGSTAPFIGLFGTVWGIMNSFIGISKAQTTNLAVVAPGIAEALLATAIGLVAAIPAVVVYNLFARAISGYRGQLGDASAAILRLVSRDLDRGALAFARAAE